MALKLNFSFEMRHLRTRNIIFLSFFAVFSEFFIYFAAFLLPIFNLLILFYSFEMLHNLLISFSKGYFRNIFQTQKMLIFIVLFLGSLIVCIEWQSFASIDGVYVFIAYLLGRAFYENSRKYLQDNFFLLVDHPKDSFEVFFLNIFFAKSIVAFIAALSMQGVPGLFDSLFNFRSIIYFPVLAIFCNFRLITNCIFKNRIDCFVVEKNLPHRFLSIVIACPIAFLIADSEMPSLVQWLFYLLLVVSVFSLKAFMTERATPSIQMEMRETLHFIQTEGKVSSLHHALL
jgi:hypothetical protein